MTRKERDRRISEMSPKAVLKIVRMYHNMTYSARELHAFRIPGTCSLAHINAVFEREAEDPTLPTTERR